MTPGSSLPRLHHWPSLPCQSSHQSLTITKTAWQIEGSPSASSAAWRIRRLKREQQTITQGKRVWSEITLEWQSSKGGVVFCVCLHYWHKEQRTTSWVEIAQTNLGFTNYPEFIFLFFITAEGRQSQVLIACKTHSFQFKLSLSLSLALSHTHVYLQINTHAQNKHNNQWSNSNHNFTYINKSCLFMCRNNAAKCK